MRSLLFRTGLHDEDLVVALWEGGTCGIIEDESGVRAFFEEGIDIGAIKTHWTDRLIEERPERAGATYAPSTADWDGVCAGKRFFLAPPWVTADAPNGRTRITVDSGAAFGTGRHESTQMMIERLESILEGGETVVDVGCGSGVLCEISRLLGAGAAFGCDIDPVAVTAAAANFEMPVFIGSADAVASESADILLVNISAKAIDALAGELKRIASPNAVVLLSGFVGQRTPVCFHPRHQLEQNEWLCWTGCRDDFSPRHALASPLSHELQWW